MVCTAVVIFCLLVKIIPKFSFMLCSHCSNCRSIFCAVQSLFGLASEYLLLFETITRSSLTKESIRKSFSLIHEDKRIH